MAGGTIALLEVEFLEQKVPQLILEDLPGQSDCVGAGLDMVFDRRVIGVLSLMNYLKYLWCNDE